MPVRIASAAVAVPVVALFVWFGAPWFSLLIIAVSMIATAEACSLVKHQNLTCSTSVATVTSGLLIALAYYLSFHPDTTVLLAPFVAACAATGIVWLLWSKPGNNGWATTVLSTVASAFYVGGTLFHAPLLISMPDGQLWVLFLLAVTSGMDTCAYLCGRFVGKHAMAPSISPSKTWEGAIAGALSAVSIAVGASLILNLHMGIAETLLVGLSLGIAGQIGDLVESRVKRKAGVKDSGKLMPGHGGFLDRLDSIVFNLVVLYYFLR